MVHNWKLASAGTLLFLAVTALVLYACTREPNTSTFQLANGVQVTSIEVKPDDTLALLDAKIWKYDVTLPDTTKMYDYTLNLCRNGKIIAPLGGVGSGPAPGESLPHHIQVTVGMAPMDDTFSKAKRVRYSIRVYGAGSKGTFSNPFGDGVTTYSEMLESSPPDNLIYLMSGNKGNANALPAASAVAIALKIEPSSNLSR